MNSKSVTKLVLLAEIIAICILHSVKMNHDQKPQPHISTVSYSLDKKLANAAAVSFTSHQ